MCFGWKILNHLELKLYLSHPANTGKPIVAVLIKAPAKIMKGIKGYFSIISWFPWFYIGNYTIMSIYTSTWLLSSNNLDCF